MNFLSLIYGLFLLSVVGLYWSVPNPRLRAGVLLLASLLFYATLQIQYIPLLLMATWITFALGRAIGTPPNWRLEDWQYAQQDWNRRRIKLLWLGIGLNLVLLLSFKYVPFVLSGLGAALKLPLVPPGTTWKSLSLLAPIGLSFFSFECVAYLVDVYRGAPAAQRFLRFAAYKLFFAKLISGPVTRYHLFADQLQTLTLPPADQITEGLWLIACGAVKKGLIADRLGNYVNLTFDNLQRAGSGDIGLATLCYGFQLYLDFSGYVDVARGSALLLGFNLPQNFEFPYFSTSIADFWRRWHMTLGDWLRNYLYFPLGGSRQGLFRTCANLIIVMLLAGLWHGAAWGFILWGGLHGLALAAHRVMDVWAKRWTPLAAFWASIPGAIVGWALTMAMVFSTWVIFRLSDLGLVQLALSRSLNVAADPQFTQKVYAESLGLYPPQIAACLGLLILGMTIAYGFHRGLKLQLNWYLKLMLVPLCLYGVWLFAPQGAARYIYFDF